MRAPLIPLACLVLAAAFGPARAAMPPSPVERAALARFNRLDGDGGLSRRELARLGSVHAADQLFALLDPQGDGRITLASIAQRGNAALLARFRAYDADKRGVVTRRDFPNYVDPALFAALDTNHDGRLSLAELRPEFAGSHARENPPPPPPPPERHPAPRPGRPCWTPVVNGSGFWLQIPMPGSACPG
jgi:hypothetical protein